jgi:hypothetical protein
MQMKIFTTEGGPRINFYLLNSVLKFVCHSKPWIKRYGQSTLLTSQNSFYFLKRFGDQGQNLKSDLFLPWSMHCTLGLNSPYILRLFFLTFMFFPNHIRPFLITYVLFLYLLFPPYVFTLRNLEKKIFLVNL